MSTTDNEVLQLRLQFMTAAPENIEATIAFLRARGMVPSPDSQRKLTPEQVRNDVYLINLHRWPAILDLWTQGSDGEISAHLTKIDEAGVTLYLVATGAQADGFAFIPWSNITVLNVMHPITADELGSYVEGASRSS